APPPAPPPPLEPPAAVALQWIDSHATPFVGDSLHRAPDPAAVSSLAAGASVMGVSELTEGTAQFAGIIQDMLADLAPSGFRALSIQASMSDALELDRYVRGGKGDAKRLLQRVGPEHWQTRQMLALVNWMR